MHDLFPFLLGVIFVVINGLTQLVFAQTQGFKLKPSSIGLLLGAAVSLPLGIITPITGQSAMIALAGKTEESRQRVAALLIAAATMAVLGITGAVSEAVNFAGPAIIAGMMAGVGLMLTQVGVDFIFDKQKGNLQVGIVSFISAMAIYVITLNTAHAQHALVYTIAGSVTISTLYFIIFQKKKMDAIVIPEGESDSGKFWTKAYWKTNDWKLVKPKLTFRAILSALALICLGIGITTSFGNINASMAGLEQNLDHLTFISGLAGFASVIFGGMPLETIISGTAAAPWPIIGSFAVLVVLAILLLLGLVNKLCKYMPTQSIAGFLVVIGFFITFLPNLRNPNFTGEGLENLPVAGTVMGVTALTSNPFLGVLAGLVIRAFGYLIGL
ncbi:MAG: xanthine/uracil permease [Lachnospiraceae bacterium]|nr:xanthine/uracil permease [Lachnospiraceae bacterium]